MKIIFIAREPKGIDGGTVIIKRNLSLLHGIYGEKNVIEIFVDFESTWGKIKNIVLAKPLGYNKKVLKNTQNILENENIKLMFIDHSLLGGFTHIFSGYNIPIVTFFHNVEYIYYQEKLKIDGIINFPMLYWARLNEKKAIKCSDYILTMTKHDSNKLKELYGREADLLLPSSVPDLFVENHEVKKGSKFHLFVGSGFFANIEGISWYIENVLPNVSIKLLVVGKGMEQLQNKYPFDNLEILGFVDDLEPYYAQAEFVISPIFSGSGMKTKTAEALMFGKTIFGTSEAFEGYEIDIEQVGKICNTKDEYVKALNNFLEQDRPSFNGYSRHIFLKKYSYLTIKETLENFLQNRI